MREARGIGETHTQIMRNWLCFGDWTSSRSSVCTQASRKACSGIQPQSERPENQDHWWCTFQFRSRRRWICLVWCKAGRKPGGDSLSSSFLFCWMEPAHRGLCSQVQTLTSSGDGLTETPRNSITQDLPFCSDVDITLSSKGACRHLDSRSVPPSPPASSFSLFSFDNQQLSNRMMPTSFKEVGRGLQTPGEDRATPWV